MRGWTLQILVLFFAISFAATAEAQQTGLQMGAPAAPTGFSSLDQPLSENQRLILQAVRDSNPTEPVQVIDAANTLMNIGLKRDVRFLLNRLDAIQLTDAQWLDVIDETGSTFFLDVFTDVAVQPEGRKVARKVLSAARRAASESSRVQRLIKTLSSADVSAKRKAFQRIQSLGEAGIAELMNVFADSSRSSEYAQVRLAVDELASSLPQPLIGAARATNPTVRNEAIRALTNVKSDAATEVLMWSYLNPNHPAALQQLSLQELTKRGVVPSPTEIENKFFQRAFGYVRGEYDVAIPYAGKVDVWDWDAKQEKLTKSTIDAETATRLTAARQAASLYEINPASKRNRAIFLLTQLESAQRLAGGGQPINTEQVVSRLSTTAREIDSILAQAVRLNLFPAATACCQILKDAAEESFLHRFNGKPSPLVMAVTSGDRGLQYAAFDAIRTINPQRAYVGSSHVLTFAVYLAQSQGQPLALVGHRDPTIGETYAAQVKSEGVKGVSVSSSRQLFEVATTNPDIEMIMISDTLVNPSYLNLIRQLRSDWRTRHLPIAYLYTDLDRGQYASMHLNEDQRFASIPFTANPRIVSSHVLRLVDRIEPFRIARTERRRQSSEAVAWLETIANDRVNYRYYDLARHQDALNDLIFQPGFETRVSGILSTLGTPSSQRQLVNFASQSSLPITVRKAAAEAFQKSVNKAGTLLTTRQIQQQYDRYNASESEPVETQKVLGTILDVIERK